MSTQPLVNPDIHRTPVIRFPLTLYLDQSDLEHLCKLSACNVLVVLPFLVREVVSLALSLSMAVHLDSSAML